MIETDAAVEHWEKLYPGQELSATEWVGAMVDFGLFDLAEIQRVPPYAWDTGSIYIMISPYVRTSVPLTEGSEFLVGLQNSRITGDAPPPLGYHEGRLVCPGDPAAEMCENNIPASLLQACWVQAAIPVLCEGVDIRADGWGVTKCLQLRPLVFYRDRLRTFGPEVPVRKHHFFERMATIPSTAVALFRGLAENGHIPTLTRQPVQAYL